MVVGRVRVAVGRSRAVASIALVKICHFVLPECVVLRIRRR